MWSRRSIEWPDGRIDQETRVWWIQADPCFIDLRLPPIPPNFSALQCPHGFAGTLGEKDGGWLWDREIDLQPPTGKRDIGTLRFEGGKHRMIEEGMEDNYTEVWERIDDGSSTDGQAFVALLQTHEETGVLIALGDHFMFARNGREIEISHGYRVGPMHEWLVSESSQPSRERKRLFGDMPIHIDWQQRVLVEAKNWQIIEPAAGSLDWVH